MNDLICTRYLYHLHVLSMLYCGRPDFINSRMLALTTLLDLPFLSGII
jgi:hypothetical protein